MARERTPETIIGEIRGLLDDDPMWVDFENRDDELVSYLLREGSRGTSHVSSSGSTPRPGGRSCTRPRRKRSRGSGAP
ncbi:MAG: hypothetical protein FJZ92_01145 [Chloroflexi bacterium]|nr:hypothetical protein [Chloroflexota bacterium]